jgi:hypothetical protein
VVTIVTVTVTVVTRTIVTIAFRATARCRLAPCGLLKKKWIRKPLCLDQKVAGRRIKSLTVLAPGHVVIVIGEAEADGCKRGKN